MPCAACEITSCQISMKEVAYFGHLSEKGANNLHHFCGLDCLEMWRRRAKEEFPTGLATRTSHIESGEDVG